MLIFHPVLVLIKESDMIIDKGSTEKRTQIAKQSFYKSKISIIGSKLTQKQLSVNKFEN